MKLTKLITWLLALLIPVLLLMLFSCGDNPLSNEFSPDRIGYTTDEINWISWQPGVIETMHDQSLARGFAGKYLTRNNGGKVGGWITFDNKVKIKRKALPADTYVSVEVMCVDVDGDEQCGAQVQFLPSMQFDKNIKIQLSWAWLDLTDDESADFDPTVYWSDDGGANWYVIDNCHVNYNKQTIKFRVDHFTIFAWGEAPPSGE
ncbi:MAG: hypothetical protein HQ562_07915 [Candidatus Marinimicrobia bacterium]|nr:hypothetical protein [Candidatus Neomarinimicrobiota bacterium]